MKKNLVLIDVSGSSLYNLSVQVPMRSFMSDFVAPVADWLNSNCPEVHTAENDVFFIGSNRVLVSIEDFDAKYLEPNDEEGYYSYFGGGSLRNFREHDFPALDGYASILFVTDAEYPYELVDSIFTYAAFEGVERLIILPIIKKELFKGVVSLE